MRLFFYFLIFILSSKIYADDIMIIELHDNQNVDKGLIEATQNNVDTEENNVDTEENNETENNSIKEEIKIEGSLLTNENDTSEDIVDINIQEISSNDNNQIFALPEPWEKSNKENLYFLFEKINITNSYTLNNILIQFLESSSKPKNITKSEFNNVKTGCGSIEILITSHSLALHILNCSSILEKCLSS